jgi:hypothetical protein
MLEGTTRLADPGEIETEKTGVTVTVIDAVAVRPSQVAVMVAVPTAAAVTNPTPFTVATEELLVDQLTTRPVNKVPLASRGDAVSCTVSPTSTVDELGVNCNDATGVSCTVMADEPDWPSLVAVTVAVPTARPVTTPPLTVAAVVLLLTQLTTRFVRTLPEASRIVAVRVSVRPTSTVPLGGATWTVATGGRVTVTIAVSRNVVPVAVPITRNVPELSGAV